MMIDTDWLEKETKKRFSLLDEAGTAENWCPAVAEELDRTLFRRLPPSSRFTVRSLLTALDRIDAIPFLVYSRHRDHFDHSLAVALLGECLLCSMVPGGDKLCDVVASLLSCHKKEDVLTAWWMAALFHDSGYPFQCFFGVVMRLLDTLVNARTSAALRHVATSLAESGLAEVFDRDLLNFVDQAFRAPKRANDHALSLVEKMLQERFCVLKPTEWKRACQGLNRFHGLWSATNLAARLSNSGGITRATWPGESEPVCHALRAISLHDLTDWQINFEEDPLSYLLVLCDELQEYGRVERPKYGGDVIQVCTRVKMKNVESLPSVKPLPRDPGIVYCCDPAVLRDSGRDVNEYLRGHRRTLCRLHSSLDFLCEFSVGVQDLKGVNLASPARECRLRTNVTDDEPPPPAQRSCCILMSHG